MHAARWVRVRWANEEDQPFVTTLELEEQGVTLMDYIKKTYHYRPDRVSKALNDLTGEE